VCEHILKLLSNREPYVVEQLALEYLVANPAVLRTLVGEPVERIVEDMFARTEQRFVGQTRLLQHCEFDDVVFGMFGERIEQRRIRISRHFVVAVHERYVSAHGMLQSEVACVGESAVRFVEAAYVGVLCRVFVSYSSALVGRTVVDEQQFAVADALRKHAVYASAQRVCHIIYRYYYAQSHGLRFFCCVLR
jgi:hypothetical protein